MPASHSDRLRAVHDIEYCATAVHRQVSAISDRITLAGQAITTAPPVRWLLALPVASALVPLVSLGVLSVIFGESPLTIAATLAHEYGSGLLIVGWLLACALWWGWRSTRPGPG